jgi:hypothetical protein
LLIGKLVAVRNLVLIDLGESAMEDWSSAPIFYEFVNISRSFYPLKKGGTRIFKVPCSLSGGFRTGDMCKFTLNWYYYKLQNKQCRVTCFYRKF